MSEDTRDHTATRAFYDRISSAYDLIADAGEHRCRARGLEALEVREGERALEVGFGTGHALVALATAVGDSGSVSGVDISAGMEKVARRRLHDAGLEDRVELAVAAVPPLPYEDARFDVASLSFTLELFPVEQIPEVLAEIRRVLRPGARLGVVAMAETAEGQRESVLTHTYKWLHRHFPHIVDCQPIDAAGHLERAGFELAVAERLAIWSLPVAVLVGRRS
jgi:ubiquinone/menaquinone biosynthesis C-methylase UbiE